jgi:Spy/CpxP family protein refolding chaperone
MGSISQEEKMTKLRTLRNLVIATGTLALLFAGTALSQEGQVRQREDAWRSRNFQGQRGQMRGQMRRANRPSIREELGLSAEQEEKLQALHRDARKARIRSRADHQILRLDMAALMRADNPDRGAITAKLEEMAAMRTSQVLAGLDHRAAVQEILTPEQWEKMKTHRRRAGRRSIERRMQHNPRRGGPHGMQGRPGRFGGQGLGMGGPGPWADQDDVETDDEMELDEDSFPADEPQR